MTKYIYNTRRKQSISPSASLSLSRSLDTGGILNVSIKTPTSANAILVIIQARSTHAPPSSNPIWKTLIIDRLAMKLLTNCKSSMPVKSWTVSSHSMRTMSNARVRHSNPIPEDCTIKLRMNVPIAGERPMPNVPSTKHTKLPSVKYRFFWDVWKRHR